MLNFEVNTKAGVINLNLPSTLEEITPDYLKAVTNQINLADDYSLIAICYRENIANVVLSGTKKGKLTTNVVPIFVKSGKTGLDYINNIECGDKLIIGSSDIAMGFHATTPKNKITFNHIVDYFAADKASYQKALTIKDYCYFVEFKIVPNCNIHGHYSNNDESFENPFVKVESKESN